METNPLDAVELPREEKMLATFLTAEDVERIRRAIQADYDLKRAEGKATEGEILWLADVVTFAVATGLRREEICALRWDAVNLTHRFITVGKSARTKGRHQRPVPLAPPAHEILVRRRQQDASGTGYVFRGGWGGKMSGDHLGKRFKEAARLAKLPEDVTFHSLRHLARHGS